LTFLIAFVFEYSLTSIRASATRSHDGQVEAAESSVAAIDAIFCEPDYFGRTPGDEVRALEEERAGLQRDVTDLLAEWEKLEAAIVELGGGAA